MNAFLLFDNFPIYYRKPCTFFTSAHKSLDALLPPMFGCSSVPPPSYKSHLFTLSTTPWRPAPRTTKSFTSLYLQAILRWLSNVCGTVCDNLADITVRASIWHLSSTRFLHSTDTQTHVKLHSWLAIITLVSTLSATSRSPTRNSAFRFHRGVPLDRSSPFSLPIFGNNRLFGAFKWSGLSIDIKPLPLTKTGTLENVWSPSLPSHHLM